MRQTNNINERLKNETLKLLPIASSVTICNSSPLPCSWIQILVWTQLSSAQLTVLVFIVCHSNNRAPHISIIQEPTTKVNIEYRIGWVMLIEIFFFFFLVEKHLWTAILNGWKKGNVVFVSFTFVLLPFLRIFDNQISKFEFLKFAFAKCFLRFDCFDDRWFGFCRAFLGRWSFFFICFLFHIWLKICRFFKI